MFSKILDTKCTPIYTSGGHYLKNEFRGAKNKSAFKNLSTRPKFQTLWFERLDVSQKITTVQSSIRLHFTIQRLSSATNVSGGF
jgi:hypothetical protein